jgi:hypothetical protein
VADGAGGIAADAATRGAGAGAGAATAGVTTAGAAADGAASSGQPSANACTAETKASPSASAAPLRNFHWTPTPISCKKAVLRAVD